MRDIIWTLIIVWLIYKIVDIFRNNSTKRTSAADSHSYDRNNHSTAHSTSKPEADIRNAVKKHLNNEGEYVDFEEVK